MEKHGVWACPEDMDLDDVVERSGDADGSNRPQGVLPSAEPEELAQAQSTVRYQAQKLLEVSEQADENYKMRFEQAWQGHSEPKEMARVMKYEDRKIVSQKDGTVLLKMYYLHNGRAQG